MILPIEWDGKDLLGTWTVTMKLDGVRALSDGHTVLSRKNKPLYGMDHIADMFSDAEIFCGSFKETISTVRTVHGRRVDIEQVYSLTPCDDRLYIDEVYNPDHASIQAVIDEVSKPGVCDGVVLRQGDVWIKCKPVVTLDLVVTGIQPGCGKHTGRMGALITSMGKIGTGFTDVDRVVLNKDIIGKTIEVSYMELTTDGKLRHPRFVRTRPDKD
jgi:ATP-dependent DNA ligase